MKDDYFRAQKEKQIKYDQKFIIAQKYINNMKTKVDRNVYSLYSYLIPVRTPTTTRSAQLRTIYFI